MYTRRKKEELKGRILAIDYGEKRIGLAVSDPLYITAQGLQTVTRRGKDEHLTAIRAIVREYNVCLILVGMPLTLSGKKADAALRVERFTDTLKDAVDVPIDYIDERLTSVAAKRALVEMGYKTGHRKELVDMTAAILMLQTYLDGL